MLYYHIITQGAAPSDACLFSNTLFTTTNLSSLLHPLLLLIQGAAPSDACLRCKQTLFFTTTHLYYYIYYDSAHPRSSFQRCLSALPAGNTVPELRCEQYVPIVKLSNEFGSKVEHVPVENVPAVNFSNEYGSKVEQ